MTPMAVCDECREHTTQRRSRCRRCGKLVCGSCNNDGICLTCFGEIMLSDDGEPDGEVWHPVITQDDRHVGWRRGVNLDDVED